jgi:hypothetical protein
MTASLLNLEAGASIPANPISQSPGEDDACDFSFVAVPGGRYALVVTQQSTGSTASQSSVREIEVLEVMPTVQITASGFELVGDGTAFVRGKGINLIGRLISAVLVPRDQSTNKLKPGERIHGSPSVLLVERDNTGVKLWEFKFEGVPDAADDKPHRIIVYVANRKTHNDITDISNS